MVLHMLLEHQHDCFCDPDNVIVTDDFKMPTSYYCLVLDHGDN